tara:strand:- start:747 stop:1127 length:381 start_codon:yes stop_codon:yes gene_type:complete
MTKKFNIHDWQAKQRQQPLNEVEMGTDVPFGGSRGRSPEWLDAEVSKYIGQTFASWMSPDNPPFAQEYAQPPYIDKLVKGIMDIVNSRDLDEMNTLGSAGAGTSIKTGDSGAYATPYAFKKKRKKD